MIFGVQMERKIRRLLTLVRDYLLLVLLMESGLLKFILFYFI